MLLSVALKKVDTCCSQKSGHDNQNINNCVFLDILQKKICVTKKTVPLLAKKNNYNNYGKSIQTQTL